MGKFDPVKYISHRYSGRKPSTIRNIISQNVGVPGMLSLAGGLPNPQCFPFTGLSATLADGTKLDVDGARVKESLQYSASKGMPRLREQLMGMQTRYHAPPSQTDVIVGCGSQGLLAQTFDMLLNPGDPLLVEEPTYSGALAALQPVRPTFVPLQTDGEGLIPASLRSTLDGWDAAARGMPKPRVLYTIPTGQNPSGATVTTERRAEVYAIAQEHGLVIMEDDPYYYLYYGTPPPSYLSMDVDGRVVRFDSLSKVLSSGMRLGMMTAHPEFIHAVEMDIQGTILHTSNTSQVLCSTLLDHWGPDGWDAHVESVKAFYKQRRDVFLALCDKHLTGLAEWNVPEAGMFVWFTIPGVSDTLDLIMKKAKEEKVLLVPGQSFFTDGKPVNSVRAAFSVASDEEMDEALRRLASLIRANSDQ
eukprot:TRINITY_DN12006_c0_g1_i1.p1 TRINITY_DN12006_c0_g1~~TRINITY_DN12006_c0_g1_i1.p1  ORF type:complete len:417 (+),score=114.95 TRINITY_DN12006_c0_g1_i1:64-1314(+)